MIDFPTLPNIVRKTPSRILMLVVDGLGGLPHPDTGRSELETAVVPNLDRLAKESACGLVTPVLPGVAPGSGPGHLALFGYDPLKYFVGRGVLEALGCDIALEPGDVASRGNFCTVTAEGLVADRRAGRITSDESTPLCSLLDRIRVPGVQLSVHPVRDYRFVLVLRGDGLSEQVTQTDPEHEDVAVPQAQALLPTAEKTASAVNRFVEQAREILRGRSNANMVLLRGFSQVPVLPSMGDAYLLNPAAVAAYPMYRGLARALGMRVIPTGSSFADEVSSLSRCFHEHDFFYLHYKPADAAGEDGNFEAKVRALEQLDAFISELEALCPDVLVVTGDHATPAVLASHSWHPVPLLIHSQKTRGDGVSAFSERACATGSLGRISSLNVMLLALAHADKLAKYGP